jgi:glycosyltransferase involved in cell wall biosynthesis
MQKISATIITFNEERKIAACLASLQGVADEIVVLDSFSTDKTADICKQFGAKVYQQAWRGYGQQKNDAASKAANNYILNVDADECLSQALQASVLQAKNAGLNGVYKMNRLNIFFGYTLKHGLTYPDNILRLYNKSEVKWAAREVHETLDVPKNIPVSKLAGDLVHKSKDSLEEFISTINKYAELSALSYFAAGKKASLFKIVFSPPVTFINGFFFKLGFLDGVPGFIMAVTLSIETFLKYSKLYLLQQNKKHTS